VEFQPSGFAKASYLNVGAMWLWAAKTHFTFDEGYRIPDQYIAFESVEQFRPLAEHLALRAAHEVEAIRARFRRRIDIFDHLKNCAEIQDTRARNYHAGVAAGLVGDVVTARHFFERVRQSEAIPHAAAWPDRANDLQALLDYPLQYRSAVAAIVSASRAALKLATEAECLPKQS
jgi:hypothetical protein